MMKKSGFMLVVFLFGMSATLGEQYETYAFGDTEEQACEQVITALNDRAILKCRMNGGWMDKAEYGDCRSKKSANGRYEATRTIDYLCKKK